MQLPLVTTLVFLALASAAPTPETTNTRVVTRYSQWAAKHGREEGPIRLKTFATNLAFIEAHDEAAAGYSLALNTFADLTVSEFVSVAFGRGANFPERAVMTLALNDTQAVDWRTKGKVNAVHDTMASGCSVPDVMADSVASAEAIKCAGASLQELSTTQLIECAAGSEGCSGFTSNFEDYVVKKGIMTSDNYAKLPGTPGTCRLNGTSTSSDLKCKVTKWVAVTPNDSVQLQAAVNEQPVVVLVNAASQAFQFYRSGILAGDCPSTPLDHAMVVVGYGSLQGKEMWIVKNDWGQQWGDEGYISIARDAVKGPGQCGIAASPAYPKLQ